MGHVGIREKVKLAFGCTSPVRSNELCVCVYMCICVVCVLMCIRVACVGLVLNPTSMKDVFQVCTMCQVIVH